MPGRKFFGDPVICGHSMFQTTCSSRFLELTLRSKDARKEVLKGSTRGKRVVCSTRICLVFLE